MLFNNVLAQTSVGVTRVSISLRSGGKTANDISPSSKQLRRAMASSSSSSSSTTASAAAAATTTTTTSVADVVRTRSDEPERVERVRGKIQRVRLRVDTATRDARRRSDDGPRLVAISKLHAPSSILAAHTYAEQTHFGENYAQELEAKARVLPASIEWHFVGKLQSNKAKLLAAIPNVFLLETLDSIKLANALEKARSAVVAAAAAATTHKTRRLGVLVQINTSGEENKGGLAPLLDEIEEDACASEVYKLAAHVITRCPSLHFRGVMTIGAAATSKANRENVEALIGERRSGEEIAREARRLNPDFDALYRTRLALVRALRSTLANDVSLRNNNDDGLYDDLLRGDDETGALELSMGMSNDLEVAVWAGSTNVRVGTDCFGVRPASRDEAMEAMKDELRQHHDNDDE